MLNTVIPKQQMFLDCYNAEIYDFNNVSSTVYLSKHINSLLNVFGKDCVINGLNVNNLEYSNDTTTNHLIKVQLTPGSVVIDTTLIEFYEIINLSLDVNDFSGNESSNSGYIGIFISYNFSNTVFKNSAKIKLLYIRDENNINNFFINHDRILLAKFLFNKQSRTVKLDNISTSVKLYNNDFFIYPVNNINSSLNNLINNLFLY
jgi:hypothetical protein